MQPPQAICAAARRRRSSSLLQHRFPRSPPLAAHRVLSPYHPSSMDPNLARLTTSMSRPCRRASLWVAKPAALPQMPVRPSRSMPMSRPPGVPMLHRLVLRLMRRWHSPKPAAGLAVRPARQKPGPTGRQRAKAARQASQVRRARAVKASARPPDRRASMSRRSAQPSRASAVAFFLISSPGSSRL